MKTIKKKRAQSAVRYDEGSDGNTGIGERPS